MCMHTAADHGLLGPHPNTATTPTRQLVKASWETTHVDAAEGSPPEQLRFETVFHQGATAAQGIDSCWRGLAPEGKGH